jgi:hypothetical protein
VANFRHLANIFFQKKIKNGTYYAVESIPPFKIAKN